VAIQELIGLDDIEEVLNCNLPFLRDPPAIQGGLAKETARDDLQQAEGRRSVVGRERDGEDDVEQARNRAAQQHGGEVRSALGGHVVLRRRSGRRLMKNHLPLAVAHPPDRAAQGVERRRRVAMDAIREQGHVPSKD